jgi:hypothetical protein
MLQPIAGYRTPSLPLLLIFAGALPFIAGAFLLVTGVHQIGGRLAVVDLLASYALIIGIFLCGIHWGHQLTLNTPGLNLFGISNLSSLVMWAGWIFLSPRNFLLLAVLHFWIIWGIDFRLLRAGHYRPDYFSARTTITTVVSICLLAALLVS